MIIGKKIFVIFFLVLSLPFSGHAFDKEMLPENIASDGGKLFVKNQILLKRRDGVSLMKALKSKSAIGALTLKKFTSPVGLELIEISKKMSIDEAIKILKNDSDVEYAEPNFYYQISSTPSDPDFGKLWGLSNTSQNNGTAGADINAISAWDITKGNPQYVLGIIDTGVLYTHPDLVDNIWTNPGEIPGNNIDDDMNGYIDDIHGINAIKGTGDPLDDHGHGTHVAGTIGARADNGIGVSGVNHVASIAGCKFLDAMGGGTSADALTCLNYFAALKDRENKPVKVIATNNSWGGGGFSQALQDAIKVHEDKGILFIAAAGNDSRDNNSAQTYPANYPMSNIISVAATDNRDGLAHFSNFGSQSVHVGAPGAKIYSTVLDNKYKEMSGTSMAAPHVTGLVGLIQSADPDLDWRQIRNLVITGGVKTPSVHSKTISGRRISAAGFDGKGSLTCANQLVTKRLLPRGNSITLSVGESIDFSVMNLNCDSPAGTPELSSLQTQLSLNDDGIDGDHLAQDGVYSSRFSPSNGGAYDFNFGDSDMVKVNVFNPGSWFAYTSSVDSVFEYRSISGTRLSLTDDSAQSLDSPFPLRFAGDEGGFSSLRVGSNGILSVTDTELISYQNTELPYTQVQTLIAPYWDDLNPGQDGGVYYGVLGQAPNRELVVEWRKVKLYGGGGSGTFQVVFFENSSDILFNYLRVDFGDTNGFGKAATVGIQTSAQKVSQFSYNSALLKNNMALRFSRN